ncbi:hypothetical protein NOVOSPHI9U_40279 [Novosphingobium sp. 9U]|nr:hypothetical protein NOVOSPHI9U_40279 [Novosphingobium sp. 9U]
MQAHRGFESHPVRHFSSLPYHTAVHIPLVPVAFGQMLRSVGELGSVARQLLRRCRL